MNISDFHAVTFIIIMLFVSSVFLILAGKLYKTTAYNLFYFGMMLFLLIGYLLAHFFAFRSGVLNGNQDMLKNIMGGIMIFWLISSFCLFLQSKRVHSADALDISDNLQIKMKKLGNLVASLTFLFVLYILFAIDLGRAPLMNIGTYTFSEMAYFRSTLYQGDMVQKTYIFQYMISYLVIPGLFLLRGMGIKINRIFLVVFLFFSLLTLSKTFFVLIVVFYFIGKFITSGKKKYIFRMAITVVLCFYLIVYSAYYVDVQRGFTDVLTVLMMRALVTPVSLSALYSEIFSYEAGVRSSVYYTYLFGGDTSPIAKAAMQYMNPNSDGNSPAGIIGAAYPNIPKVAHFLYYGVFISFILIGSNIATRINSYYIYLSLSGVFGMISWFIFVTDPLSALNSYGIMYMFALIVLVRLFIRKRATKKESKVKETQTT